MEILSVTNKKTQLHKSPTDLSVVCSHEHDERRPLSSDISFFPSSKAPKCFAQIYKGNDILEVWRIKRSKDGVDTFDRLRKSKVESIQAICCGKNKETTPEYAIGYTTGQIKIVELSSENTFKTEFPSDPSKASVISLDYSNCGGYLASVFENGTINIFGLTMKIKSDTLKLDKDSSLARFHPSKRFHLAIASFKGAVTVYDISTKKIYFQQKDAHDAPCRDVAMPEGSPDRLFTCGCDSIIKIFDTRKKGVGSQIKSSCGLSTMSVSKCGGFIAVGNLKGEVLSYDMRNLRQELAKIRIGNDLVTRIAFMPACGDGADNMTAISKRESVASMAEEVPEHFDEINCSNEGLALIKGRWSELEYSAFSQASTRDGLRASDNFGRNIANALNDLSFSSDVNVSYLEENLPQEIDDRHVNMKRYSGGKKDSFMRRRSSQLVPSPLVLIQEEIVDKENDSGALNTPDNDSFASGQRFSSTPSAEITSHKTMNKAESMPMQAEMSSEVIDVDALDTSNQNEATGGDKPALMNTITPSFQLPNIDIKKEFEAIHEKIHFEVQSLNFDLNGRHMEMMNYIFNQRRIVQSRVQMIEECMGILMNDDVKINRIMELQDENRDLRTQLDNIMKSLNP